MKNGTKVQKVNVDFKRITATASALNALCEEMCEIFPGRKGLITQIKFALLVRQHVLMYGPYGTGKTDLINTMFGQIDHAQKASFSLNKFSNDSQVFGVPSLVTVDNKTTLEFDTVSAETIFKSVFVELDELLDANAPVLRSLLGILNERVWKRGRFIVECVLHTAMASTNKNPEEECKNDPQLEAVLDRFMFHCHVDWLTDTESRLKMYSKFLNGSTPTVTIDYPELEYFSATVLGANQISEPVIVETYEKVIEEFSTHTKRKISDRRRCRVMQLIEAQALLNGRFEVYPEDILAVKYGLCYGNDTEEQDAFDKIAAPHIEAAKELMAQDIDKLQLDFIAKLEEELVELKKVLIDQNNFIKCTGQLNKIRLDADTVKTQLESTKLKQKELNESIDQYQAALDKFAREVR